MMSTVTNRGTLRFMFYQGAMTASRLIDFLRRLIRSARRKVFLILDNLKVHHARKVADWVAERSDPIAIFHLPGYSPDLNPDEYLNGDLKARLRNCSQSREKGQLKAQAVSIMRELQKKPEHIRSYFEHEAVEHAR